MNIAATGMAAASHHRPFDRFFATLGPGLITGAADDDPSGISTYSVVGASFGYGLLWTALFSYPLMVAIQLMCARLGMVTGHGLAGVIRRRYSPLTLWGACTLLAIANTINIAADLAGMAAATELVSHVRTFIWLPLYAALLSAALLWTSYRSIARLFKWLTVVLLAYVLAAFFARVDWHAAVRATFIPHVELTRQFFAALVGIFGTTISPYLFFWQAAQEVEEERAMGRDSQQRRGATPAELRDARTDVMTGMFASNAVMFFIILTTSATLHHHGRTTITTAREAAEALRPLAGAGAYWLFTVGIIGTGILAVPILAGSCAYAIAEAAAWRHQTSLAVRPGRARKFYSVMIVAMCLGLALDYAGFNAIRLLFVTAIINGVLAPPLILIIVLLTSDPEVMGDAVNPPSLRGLGWATFTVMTASAFGLLL
jgi:NRAMP (natural resistance-associated macrophage protein)-like metal ion transporter